jgi:hypothetical protein
MAGCIAPPAPKYQATIGTTELILKQRVKLAVGPFGAAPGVENHALGMRASSLHGGSDGTFSTYLRDAVVSELQTAGSYETGNDGLQLSGVLTRNELDCGIKTGSAAVGGKFSLTRNGQTTFSKAFVAEHEWESSFIGAVAIPMAIDNYTATVQQLLGKLFADSEFVAALHSDGTTH